MIDGIWKPEAVRLQSCHEETVRLSKLVGDLEKLSLYEGENLVLTKRPFDISSLIARVALNFEAEFKSKGIALQAKMQPVEIVADEDKISQVLVNLLSNALKYTNEGGEVAVKTIPKEDAVEIEISDTGIGISDEDQQLIFERFYRTDLSRNRKSGGSGIGLAIAKAIISAHHGTIAVKSTPGIGSTFTIILPR